MPRETYFSKATPAFSALAVLSGAYAWQVGHPGEWALPILLHIVIGTLAAISTISLLLSARTNGARALALTFTAAILGIGAFFYSEKYLGALHAWVGFVALASIAAATIPLQRNDPRTELVDDRAWPSLRAIAALLLAVETLQVTFGVAFRHNIYPNIIPHAVGAAIVAFLLIFTIIVVLQRPHDRNVNRAALWSMTIAILQVMSGVFAFYARAQQANENVPTGPIATLDIILHVTNAGLTFAATAVLATVIFRSVNPAIWPHPRPRHT